MRVMSRGTAWCLRNGPTSNGPQTGVVALPKESQIQWMMPVKKSAQKVGHRQSHQTQRKRLGGCARAYGMHC